MQPGGLLHHGDGARRRVSDTVGRPGRALEPGLQRFFGTRMGHDFSRVRIHADRNAATSAAELGADAYTAGRSIVFADGRYAPGHDAGRRLLGHELAHVAQQGGAELPTTGNVRVDPSSSAEAAAGRASAAPATPAPGAHVQRQSTDESRKPPATTAAPQPVPAESSGRAPGTAPTTTAPVAPPARAPGTTQPIAPPAQPPPAPAPATAAPPVDLSPYIPGLAPIRPPLIPRPDLLHPHLTDQQPGPRQPEQQLPPWMWKAPRPEKPKNPLVEALPEWLRKRLPDQPTDQPEGRPPPPAPFDQPKGTHILPIPTPFHPGG